MASWFYASNGLSGQVAFTDTSTPDFFGPTSDIEFNVVAEANGNITLQAVTGDLGYSTWYIWVGIRII